MLTTPTAPSTRFGPRNAAALLFATVVALGGCGGGDSSDPVRVFFATNNLGECHSIGISVDLLTAGAQVGRLEDGTLDCAIDSTLEAMGCMATFDEFDDGNSLSVDIDGCNVPTTSSLFGCEFTKGDVSALRPLASSFCDCVGEPVCDWNPFCDETPSVCLTLDGDPRGCEDCHNGIDDDGDGFVDCNDNDCFVSDCGFGNSTVTCPVSTSTTLTTTTTID